MKPIRFVSVRELRPPVSTTQARRDRLIALMTGLLLFCGVRTPAHGGPKDFGVFVTRLGGDPISAKPFIDKLAAYLEQEMGWAKGLSKGSFFSGKEEAIAFFKGAQPGFAVLEPPLFFELRQANGLTPIVAIESPDLVSPQLHLVVLNPAWSSIEQLKGKTLWTTLADSPRYLSQIVFGGEVEASRYFKTKKIGHALKGVRAVLRKQADATLLDDGQLASAKQMAGGSHLRSIYHSPALVPLPVVAFSKRMTLKEQKTLAKVLLKMCSTPAGAKICHEIRINKFVPIQTSIFHQAQERYEKPSIPR